MRVLQLFHRYLDTSSNWIYNQLRSLEDVKLVIGTPIFLNEEQFRLHGVEVIPVPFFLNDTSRQNTFFNQKVKWNKRSIKKWMKKNVDQYDLVHAHFSFTGCEYMQVCESLGKPLLVSFYGYDYENLPYEDQKWHERYHELFKRAKYIIAEGPHGAETLEKIGCPKGKITIIPLGVNIPKAVNAHHGKRSGELKLIQIANFKEKKGHIYTLQAFANALKSCPEMTLTIVGSGNQGIQNQLINTIKEEGIGSKVTMLEGIDFSELYTFLQHFDVLIQPSIYTSNKDSEGGAPIILIDAQAAGIPVISSFHADIPNVVLDGETSILSKEKDVDGLTEAIQRFYTMDQNEYRTFSNKAKSSIEDNFDSKICAARLKELYEKVS